MPRRPTLNPEWAAPSVWALPQVLMGQARTRGAAPNLSEAERRGIASPHIAPAKPKPTTAKSLFVQAGFRIY